MATRGARALRAAVVTVMVTGLLAVAQPAQAQAPNVQLASISNVELKVGGGTQTVQIQVRNQANGDPETDTARGVTLTMQVPLGDFGVGIVSAEVINGSGCSTSGNPPNFMQCPIGDLGPGETRTIAAHLAVDPSSPLPAGESRNGEAVVQLGTGERQKFNIRLQGPDQAPSITRISGVVTDQATGEPIDGANVLLIDGAGAEHRRGTDSQGRFDIRPEPDRPIAPGRIAMVAEKTGYQGQQYQHEVPLRAGDSVTDVHLVMINQQVQESPTPEPTESPAPEPTASPTPAAAPVEDEGESGGGLTFFTKVMIIIGVLLVLLGVGAIALLIWRRRRDEGEDDGGFDDADDPVSGPSGPTPTPGSRGVYRPSPTQVAGAGAATQVIPRAGAPASGLPAVGPSPALAQTSLMGTGATPSDATTVLPRADDPTQVGGAFGDERTRVMRSDGGFGEERTTVMRPDGGFGEERTTVMRPDDATQLIGSPGAGPGGRGRPTSGAPAEPPAGAAPASGPSVGSAPGAPSAPRRAAPQPPTYNGAPEQPYGYEQGGYHSRYDEPSHQGPHAGGYDEPTSRYDYDTGPRGGGDYGRATHDSGYGPDPYAQPSAGYRDYGTDSYSQGDYGTERYQGYEAGGYDSGSAGGYGGHGGQGGHGYQDADYSGGYGEPASDYGQPGGGHYGSPHTGGGYAQPSGGGYGPAGAGEGYGHSGAGDYDPGAGGGYAGPSAGGGYPASPTRGYEPDYYDETGRPRPRHSGPDRGWSEH